MKPARGGRRRGQALVEVCLTFPLVLLVIFAIIDLAYMGFQRVSLQSAAVDGARFAATRPRPELKAVVARVRAAAPGIRIPDGAIKLSYGDAPAGVAGVAGSALVEIRTRVRPMSGAILPKGLDAFTIRVLATALVPTDGEGATP